MNLSVNSPNPSGPPSRGSGQTLKSIEAAPTLTRPDIFSTFSSRITREFNQSFALIRAAADVVSIRQALKTDLERHVRETLDQGTHLRPSVIAKSVLEQLQAATDHHYFASVQMFLRFGEEISMTTSPRWRLGEQGRLSTYEEISFVLNRIKIGIKALNAMPTDDSAVGKIDASQRKIFQPLIVLVHDYFELRRSLLIDRAPFDQHNKLNDAANLLTSCISEVIGKLPRYRLRMPFSEVLDDSFYDIPSFIGAMMGRFTKRSRPH